MITGALAFCVCGMFFMVGAKMISQQSVQLIKATSEAMSIYIEQIARCLYDSMFAVKPELKNMFNQTRQKSGAQDKVMANFIAYVTQNIDKVDEMRPLLLAIANKHSSVGVISAHYPVMRTHLVLAIVEVMGDEIPHAVINAWLEVFDYFTGVLTEAETGLYVSAGIDPGQWIHCKLISREQLIKGVVSLTFEILDNNHTFKFNYGQYIALRVSLGGIINTRQYYITAMDGNIFSIAVRAESVPITGLISYYLMEQALIGDKLEIGAPSGTFVVNDLTKNMVFISNSVGGAVINSMARYAVHNSMERIDLIHVAKSSNELIQLSEVMELAKQYSNFFYHIVLDKLDDCDVSNSISVQSGGVIGVKPLLKSILEGKNVDFYMCGSDFFLEVISVYLNELDIAEKNIHLGEMTSIWARKRV